MTENSLLSYAVDSIISEAESRLSIDAESFNLTKFFYEDLWIDFVHTHHKEQLLSIAEIDSKIVFNQIINKFEEVVDKVSGNADPTCYDFILFALYHALLEISGSNGYTIALAPLLSKILKLAIFAQVTFGIPNRLTNGCISSLNYFQNLGANLIPEIMMDAFQSGKNCEKFSPSIQYFTKKTATLKKLKIYSTTFTTCIKPIIFLYFAVYYHFVHRYSIPSMPNLLAFSIHSLHLPRTSKPKSCAK